MYLLYTDIRNNLEFFGSYLYELEMKVEMRKIFSTLLMLGVAVMLMTNSPAFILSNNQSYWYCFWYMLLRSDNYLFSIFIFGKLFKFVQIKALIMLNINLYKFSPAGIYFCVSGIGKFYVSQIVYPSYWFRVRLIWVLGVWDIVFADDLIFPIKSGLIMYSFARKKKILLQYSHEHISCI